MNKKFKFIYEITVIGEGHPLLERSVEEILETAADCILTSLPGDKERIDITWKKKPIDKE